MNLFDLPEVPADEEQFDVLHDGANCRIERIVSHAAVTAPGEWYDQEWDEWVLVLQGEGTVEYQDGRVVKLARGDHLFLPAHVKHRVAATSADPPCLWLAVHFKPR